MNNKHAVVTIGGGQTGLATGDGATAAIYTQKIINEQPFTALPGKV